MSEIFGIAGKTKKNTLASVFEEIFQIPPIGARAEKKRAKKTWSRKPKAQDDFYDSWDWKRARYQALKTHGAKCMLCGATKESGVVICVDHIKPRALYPHLELEQGNLQVLCNDCNMGKGRWDETDWRVQNG